ncbi:VOC family protein [Dietzia sp.]|uniref:VOC family protein n=1 Tax=Dietzia sp. TaxID=1871616 RepID=UPI002FDB7E89
MPNIAQVNLVVSDINHSRSFYELLGVSFLGRDRTGNGAPEAWVSQNIGITMVLHSTAFAAWWDPSSPQPARGSTQVDLEFDSREEVDAILGRLQEQRSTVVTPAREMPWGQRFTVVADQDGNRVGLKAPRSSS